MFIAACRGCVTIAAVGGRKRSCLWSRFGPTALCSLVGAGAAPALDLLRLEVVERLRRVRDLLARLGMRLLSLRSCPMCGAWRPEESGRVVRFLSCLLMLLLGLFSAVAVSCVVPQGSLSPSCSVCFNVLAHSVERSSGLPVHQSLLIGVLWD